MLTEEQEEILRHELVMVTTGEDHPLFFTHHDFIAAQQVTLLERLSQLVPEGSSARKAIRALRLLHTKREHARTLNAALRYLVERCKPAVVVREEVEDRIVAGFPLRT